MNYSIKNVPTYHIAYALLPYKRNQDVIKIIPGKGVFAFAACVVDGWNELTLNSDMPGRKVANEVWRRFPRYFISSKIRDIKKRAEEAARKTDRHILKELPMCATSVAAFLFHGNQQDVIVTVGDPEVYLWDGKTWYKPKGIDSHPLDPKKFSSNVSRFFGCPERKKQRIYSAEPDVVTISPGTPIILATDGIKDVLTVAEINNIVESIPKRTPKAIISALMNEIERRGTPKDDISILVRWSV